MNQDDFRKWIIIFLFLCLLTVWAQAAVRNFRYMTCKKYYKSGKVDKAMMEKFKMMDKDKMENQE